MTNASFGRFRVSLSIFIIGLVLSGVTAFPLLLELKLLTKWAGAESAVSATGYQGLTYWLVTVRCGLEQTYESYPWIAYGTDWLAFAHLMIAGFFIGPWLHPLTSRANLWAGIFACGAVIPLALICGPLRGIPFFWQLIDCSFGVFGVLPLWYCLRQLRHIEALRQGAEA
jgi:hypothetical protein